MNFGKHGRVALMGALLVATSTLVFGGLLPTVASADSGTIKVGDYPADNTGNANDPHLAGACVGVRLFGFDTTKPVTATFSTAAPTKPDSSVTVSGAPDGTVASFDLVSWLTGLGATAGPKGFHVSVDVDGKKKTFWVDDATKGCGSTTAACPISNKLIGGFLPANADTVPVTGGSGIGFVYKGSNPLDQSKTVFSVDGSPVTPLLFMPQSDGTVQVGYLLPQDFAGGTHSATAQVTDSTGQTGCKSWTFLSTSSSVGPT